MENEQSAFAPNCPFVHEQATAVNIEIDRIDAYSSKILKDEIELVAARDARRQSSNELAGIILHREFIAENTVSDMAEIEQDLRYIATKLDDLLVSNIEGSIHLKNDIINASQSSIGWREQAIEQHAEFYHSGNYSFKCEASEQVSSPATERHIGGVLLRKLGFHRKSQTR